MKTAEIKELTTAELQERLVAEKEALVRMQLNHSISPLQRNPHRPRCLHLQNQRFGGVPIAQRHAFCYFVGEGFGKPTARPRCPLPGEIWGVFLFCLSFRLTFLFLAFILHCFCI